MIGSEKHVTITAWRRIVVALLIAVALGSLTAQKAFALEQHSLLIDLGFGFGTRTGLVIGLKYAVLEDLAGEIFLIVPVLAHTDGGIGLGFGASYYPPALYDYCYIDLNLSYALINTQEHRHTIFAVNADFGLDTGTFQIIPALPNGAPNTVLQELFTQGGFAYMYDRDKDMQINVVSSKTDWIAPNLEFGVRLIGKAGG